MLELIEKLLNLFKTSSKKTRSKPAILKKVKLKIPEGKMRKITHIVVHHSLTEDGEEKNWNAIRKYHVEHNGWNDIGYHYGIEKVRGKITLKYGRKVSRTGAHVKGMNKTTIGICVVGNYDKRAPSKAKLDKLEALVRQLQRTFKVPSKNVVGHWEAQRLQGIPPEGRKSCPGTKFDMAAFRRVRTDAV